MPPSRIKVEYSCTYLNRPTIGKFSNIVDAGCGIGYLQRYLEQLSWTGQYVGCDLSSASLAGAQKLFPSARFVRTELSALPFVSRSVDLVYARDSVIHSQSPLNAMKELHRISRCLILRLRTADIKDVFTAHYQHADVVHQWFGRQWLIQFLTELTPKPRLIRYRLHTRHPRQFEPSSFKGPAPFATYLVADVLVLTDAAGAASTKVIDDTGRTWAGAAWQRFRALRGYATT